MGSMSVSDDDRRRFARLSADLAETELDLDATGDPATRNGLLAAINRHRRANGAADLVDEPPEEGFSRRARALGLRRSGP
jgi:hypothetical protein